MNVIGNAGASGYASAHMGIADMGIGAHTLIARAVAALQ
jgi:hypothetical protein